MMKSVEWLLDAGERVSNKDLARALKESAGRSSTPKLLRRAAMVIENAPEKQRRGPKGMSPSKMDWCMTELDLDYRQLCAEYAEERRKRKAEKKPRRADYERSVSISQLVG
jgi:hypothetical protein